MQLDKIVPESLPWRHTDEGPDDSASHTKCSLVGSSISIPISEGRLQLGTWQGVTLHEVPRLPGLALIGAVPLRAAFSSHRGYDHVRV